MKNRHGSSSASPVSAVLTPGTMEVALPSRWFYGSGLDLVIGCGAWSVPLLLLAYYCSSHYPQGVSVAFYGLALVFNYPHYMATIYRAYRTREDFAKYKIFTLHITLLVALVLVLAHVSYQLLAVVFTLYLTWSPFHYTGQNFGIALMFARRNGVKTTPAVRRTFYLSFLASYAMFFLAVHSFSSADQYILTLGLPIKAARILWVAMLGVFLVSTAYSLSVFAKQTGWRKLTAPLVMLSTQVIWFVIPTALTLFSNIDLLQARSTAGILAVMHSAQYLWITSYYAQRESQAAQSGELAVRRSTWRPYAYFAVLVIGGIALFVPGPWLASRLLHIDFMSSFLAFTAMVNIHHFLLDGAIWKLRDGRIAALLLHASVNKDSVTAAFNPVIACLTSRRRSIRVLRVAAALALLLVAGLDQLKFYYGAQASDTSSLSRAQELNPYDAALQVRLARANEHDGNALGKRAALEDAVRINPSYRAGQTSLARMLIESGSYEEAFAHYKQMFSHLTPDVDSLVNFGMLAAQLSHEDEAIAAWQKALERDAGQANAQLYLADALAKQQRFKEAIPHYEHYLALIVAEQNSAGKVLPNPEVIVKVVLQLAAACHHAGDDESALHFFSQGAALAHRVGDEQALALAWMQAAEIKAGQGKSVEALADFQRALTLENSGSIPGHAVDWLRFGKFLQQTKASPRLVFACLVKAETLLPTDTGSENDEVRALAAAIKSELESTESALGNEASNLIKDDPSLFLQEALGLKL